MIQVERPQIGPGDEKRIEVGRAKESLNRSDLEFIAAMTGVELDSMEDGGAVADETEEVGADE